MEGQESSKQMFEVYHRISEVFTDATVGGLVDWGEMEAV